MVVMCFDAYISPGRIDMLLSRGFRPPLNVQAVDKARQSRERIDTSTKMNKIALLNLNIDDY